MTSSAPAIHPESTDSRPAKTTNRLSNLSRRHEVASHDQGLSMLRAEDGGYDPHAVHRRRPSTQLLDLLPGKW